MAKTRAVAWFGVLAAAVGAGWLATVHWRSQVGEGAAAAGSERARHELDREQRPAEHTTTAPESRAAGEGDALPAAPGRASSAEERAASRPKRTLVPTPPAQHPAAPPIHQPPFTSPVPAPTRAPAAAPAGLTSGFSLVRTDAVPLDEPAPVVHDTEDYDHIAESAFRAAAVAPLSTFSIDVDTAAYANVRRFLNAQRMPPKDAVRIEELVNYFRFDYPEPPGGAPFSVHTEVSGCPWQPEHRLVAIGLQGRRVPRGELPPLNLVFLLDVSGSMNSPAKLPLLQSAMKLLVEELDADDRIAIVVYAGSSGLVLPSTSGAEKGRIVDAIDRLRAGGSTAGAAGIRLAYQVARDGHVEGGVNRVILATDGDFNVGVSSDGALVRMIEAEREDGVSLSVLGFGTGNLKDSRMEKLADHGNGNYAYIDSLREARKVLVEEAGGTLVTIAKDVKIQVEFNPATVAAYRLIGYENRALAAEDFRDDRKDAGEIGSGHSVTALYQVVPAGVEIELSGVDPLKYQAPRAASGDSASGELLTVKLRYKQPEGATSRQLSVAVRDAVDAEPSETLRFASAVAGFGMLLRDSEHKGTASFPMVMELARGARGADAEGHRAEFVRLVEVAERLAPGVRISRQ